ncbi:MAG: hypothetical protein K0S19_1165, partial [Geminicoccaceae bacterium]|nr:hypothetical protein [Geminicoccaceae bacterium]
MAEASVFPGRAQHPVEREVTQAVHSQKLTYFLDGMGGADQLFPRRGVDTVVTGAGDRRRSQPEMDLPGAGAADHLHQLFAGVAANEAVIHHDDRLPLNDLPHGIELDLHLGHAECLGRIDEGPSHVVVSNQAVFELDPRHFGEAQGHCVGTVGNAKHHLPAGSGLLSCQLTSQLAAGGIDRLAEDGAVRPGKVHQLEHAPAH